MSKTTDKTRTIDDRGIDGRGHRVFVVVTTWTRTDGRPGLAIEQFETRAEAKAWIDACAG